MPIFLYMRLDSIIVGVWNYQMFSLLYGSSHKVNDRFVVMLATSSSGERSIFKGQDIPTEYHGTVKVESPYASKTQRIAWTIWTCISCYEFVQANDHRVRVIMIFY